MNSQQQKPNAFGTTMNSQPQNIWNNNKPGFLGNGNFGNNTSWQQQPNKSNNSWTFGSK